MKATILSLLVVVPFLHISAVPAAERTGVEKTAGAQFREAYQTMIAADDVREGGEWTKAVEMYRKALNAYVRLVTLYPDWKPTLTRFRMRYCGDQLALLLERMAKEPPPAASRTERPLQASGSPPAKGDAPYAQVAVRRARTLLRANMTEEAAKLLLGALRVSPDDADVRRLLGVARCAQGRYRDAGYLLEPLAREYPRDAAARVALATAQAGMGNAAQAEATLKAALEIRPTMAEAHYNIAQLLMRKDPPDLDGARRHYRQCLENGGRKDPGLESELEQVRPSTPRKKEGGIFPFNLLRR